MMDLTTSDEGDRMAGADERAKLLAGNLKSKKLELDDAADQIARNRAMVSEQMPRLWEVLIAEFENYCNSVNQEVKPHRKLAVYMIAGYDFIVRPDANGNIVEGHYDADEQAISILTFRGVEWFIPRVYFSGAGKVILVQKNTGTTMTPENIAQNTIDDVMMYGLETIS